MRIRARDGPDPSDKPELPVVGRGSPLLIETDPKVPRVEDQLPFSLSSFSWWIFHERC